MVSEKMVAWGSQGCVIRDLAAYGEQRAAVVGAENVFNFTIGNPSVPAPSCVRQTIEHLLQTVPAEQLHAYTAAPGLASVRAKMAAYLEKTFGVGYRAEDVYMTSGASSALAMLAYALLSPGDEVLTLKGVGKSFGERTLFSGVDLKVAGGERIALIGDNGTGKSTLIKMIMGEEYPDEGRIKLGPSTKIAYLPQIIHFDVPQRNLVDTMLYSKRDITPQKARDRLAAFHFRGEDVFKSVSVLSGGEQSRLRLCMLMDDEVNFLVLDEPTNHLDIASREWIEEAVEAFDGTLLFVSHDRYFINRFATRVWELEEQRITDYPMGFARYRKIKAEQPAKKAEPEKTVKEKSLTEKPPRGNKNQQAARRQLTICEREIAQQEEALAALDARLEEAASDYEKYSALYAEKEAQEQKLTELMERWEALAAEAGE